MKFQMASSAGRYMACAPEMDMSVLSLYIPAFCVIEVSTGGDTRWCSDSFVNILCWLYALSRDFRCIRVRSFSVVDGEDNYRASIIWFNSISRCA